MKARLNGMDVELPDGVRVAELVRLYGWPTAGVAVALDGSVVPRSAWDDTVVPAAATVELVTAVQGG